MAIEIGQKVRVRGVKERVPANIITRLKQNPFGIVEDYKMVDGSGVGFVVKFDATLSAWFFEDELEAM
ncbi:MAG: cytochrome b6f subunit PetP [Microcoleaceae cyanobacterium]